MAQDVNEDGGLLSSIHVMKINIADDLISAESVANNQPLTSIS